MNTATSAGASGGARMRSAAGRLVTLWPLVPFLGFGFCGAWFALANGTVWLSSVESNGAALTNLTSVVNAVTGAALLVAFVLGRWAGRRFERTLCSRAAVLAAGVVGSVGSLLLILMGPAYLQAFFAGATFVLFQVASVLLGLSFGVLFLRLGMLYGALPLRRAILYLCYSFLVSVFVYLAIQVSPRWAPVPGSPSWALVVAFTVLPILAAGSLCVDPATIPWFSAPRPMVAEKPSESFGPQTRYLFARFCAVLFLFGLVQSAVTSSVANAASPSTTLGTYNLVMLIHVPLLLLFAALGSTLEARRLKLGKLCLVLVVLLEVLVVLALAVNVESAVWVVSVRSIAFAFETLTWCLLFAVANCHREQGFEVISLNYGVYALGLGLGTFAGAHLPDAVGSVLFYIGCALLLLPSFVLLGDKGVDGLLGSDERGVSLETLLGDQLETESGRPKGEFLQRLDAFAAEYGLSAREAETLRYLVAGRGDSQIAEAMGISYNTARTHVRNVYNKLDVHDRQTLIDVVDVRLR